MTSWPRKATPPQLLPTLGDTLTAPANSTDATTGADGEVRIFECLRSLCGNVQNERYPTKATQRSAAIMSPTQSYVDTTFSSVPNLVPHHEHHTIHPVINQRGRHGLERKVIVVLSAYMRPSSVHDYDAYARHWVSQVEVTSTFIHQTARIH